MAKVRVTTYVPDGETFLQPFDDPLFLDTYSKTRLRLSEENDGTDYVVFHGKNLTYNKGYLTGGTVTGVEFKNENGDDYFTATNVTFKVEQKIDLAQTHMYVIFELPLIGNDIVNGSREGDLLYGGGGKNTLNGLNGDDVLVSGHFKDTMTGKLGSDIFYFSYDTLKVVVTDFDAVGGGAAQDYFYFDQNELHARIYQDGDDTVLDFGDRRTMTLLDVDRGDISMADLKEPDMI